MTRPMNPKSNAIPISNTEFDSAYAPNKTSNSIPGTNKDPLMYVIFASGSRKMKQSPTVIRFEITMNHTKANVRSKCLVSMDGPGTNPLIRKAPRSNAMTTVPGTPNAIVGTNEPPNQELFAAPGPKTPRTSP